MKTVSELAQDILSEVRAEAWIKSAEQRIIRETDQSEGLIEAEALRKLAAMVRELDGKDVVTYHDINRYVSRGV